MIGTQSSSNQYTRYLIARLYLLLRLEDPEADLHPARAMLRQKPESFDFEDRWERFLVLEDFRLASLRFALAVPTCDDYYYMKPQVYYKVMAAPPVSSELSAMGSRKVRVKLIVLWACLFLATPNGRVPFHLQANLAVWPHAVAYSLESSSAPEFLASYLSGFLK